MITLESDFLMPTDSFLVIFPIVLLLGLLLVVWPLVEAVVRQQWGYALGVIVLGPIGGLVWFVKGRRETAAQAQQL